MFNFHSTGVQFIKDCPIEPYIPLYMLIGGALGAVRMFWALYSQIRSRRPEVLSVPATRPYISPMKLLSIVLSCFLVGWFALGKQEISFAGIVSRTYFTWARVIRFDPRNFPPGETTKDFVQRARCERVLRKHILHNIALRSIIILWERD